jgi:hypothetical protein
LVDGINNKLDRFLRPEYGLIVKQKRVSSICYRHIPRILFCSLLLSIISSRGSSAEELISNVLAFNPPAFLSASTFNQDGTNIESEARRVWRYTAVDNDPRTSQRLLIVSIRETGAALDPGKTAINRQLDDQALRAEMQAAVTSIPNATHVSSVTNTAVGGETALLASCQLSRPYWQKPDSVLFPSEVYWVRIQTNRVVEIKLIADSMEHLQTLKSCLPEFKITKMIPQG